MRFQKFQIKLGSKLENYCLIYVFYNVSNFGQVCYYDIVHCAKNRNCLFIARNQTSNKEVNLLDCRWKSLNMKIFIMEKDEEITADCIQKIATGSILNDWWYWKIFLWFTPRRDPTLIGEERSGTTFLFSDKTMRTLRVSKHRLKSQISNSSVLKKSKKRSVGWSPNE